MLYVYYGCVHIVCVDIPICFLGYIDTIFMVVIVALLDIYIYIYMHTRIWVHQRRVQAESCMHHSDCMSKTTAVTRELQNTHLAAPPLELLNTTVAVPPKFLNTTAAVPVKLRTSSPGHELGCTM